jgi:hypothetical protein
MRVSPAQLVRGAQLLTLILSLSPRREAKKGAFYCGANSPVPKW